MLRGVVKDGSKEKNDYFQILKEHLKEFEEILSGSCL